MGDYRRLAAVLDDLPRLVREARKARGLSTRDVGALVGIGQATVGRVERGHGCHTATAAALLRWLEES